MLASGELLLGLRYLRNRASACCPSPHGELLPGLPYLRNIDHGSSPLIVVNYYLDYRTSETL